MEQARSFIAIELPDELRQGLGRLQARLKSQPSIKWVHPDSIHLTLKFLGNIDVESIGEITGAMEEASRGVSPFRLEVSGLGVFPNPRQVRVAWVGLEGDVDSLALLQRQLETRLAHLGFTPESRPFTAHLTLARVRDGASAEERQEFGQAIISARLDMEYAIEVSAISLMRSQLTRQGAIYSRISLVRLRDE
jgi:2'-5' RNA ligase